MRTALAWLGSGFGFLREWRRSILFGYRRQYGLFAALPLAWGCLDAYLLPRLAPFGFLASALFLEGRPGKRLAWQALAFASWCLFLAHTVPDPAGVSRLPGATLLHGHASSGDAAFEMTGVVEGFPSLKRKCAFTLATERGRFRIVTDTPAFPIEPGQKLRMRVRTAPAEPPTNPGQFDYPAFLRSQGHAGVWQADALILEAPPEGFDRLVVRLRGLLEAGLTRSVPAAQAPMLRAAMLGATDDLDPGLVEDFKASGMLHILAISGQHIGIFALILLQIFSLARLPRKAAYLATGILIALYVPICGSQISVVRAAIMFWSCLPSVLWERPGGALNNLGWAAAACLLWMPYQILSLGFQLSFAATFLLILYSRTMADLLARLRVRSAVAVYFVSNPFLSVIIYLGVYPLLASAVHMAAPSSILGNLATVGLSSGMLVSACLTLLFQPAGALASSFGETAGAFAALLAASVHALALLPGSSLSVPRLPWAWSLFLLILVAALPFAVRRRRGTAMLFLGAAAFSGRWACGEALQAWRAPASVAFLDVGQGDGAVCRLPGAVILVDAGPADAGRNVILPYLRSQGINRLDIAIVTHPDLDHYGGLAHVAEHIGIGLVAYPGEEADTQAWKSLRETLARRGVPMIAVRRGQVLYRNGGMSMTVLSPDFPGQYSERNDNSVVTLLTVPGRRILFTGDIGLLPEARLLAESAAELEGAVLKVPHHGSDRTNAVSFLRAIRPGVAILSAGRRNRFGHPGPAMLEELANLDARIHSTARNGAMTYARDRASEEWRAFLPETGASPGPDGSRPYGRAGDGRDSRRKM